MIPFVGANPDHVVLPISALTNSVVLLVTSLVKYMSSLHLLVENGLVAGTSVLILHHYVTMCEYL